ncbi:MAG: beta-N-acetylhexosaminidase [Trueperaceae bacterium]|nr:beta-N-acetylhexosaminidase [Trueperaceae bacterium]MCO5174600.1 beta-N-acetylhexosaminidase [Trueperaceae bacterium]MCW5819644.1 beta-N-acetylhexosaminidase [Trueperaceae bacterium]
MSVLPLMGDLSSTAITPDERELLSERRLAGVCLFGRNVQDRYQLADYLAEARSLAGDDLIVAIDQEGGGVLRVLDVPFPPPAMALGAADDVALTEAVASATGRALAGIGINLDFAPVADVNSNPLNPVIGDRSFGADPTLVGRHVAAFVRGLQSAGVGATLKHFPGHGDTSLDSHLALPTVERSLDDLRRTELPPFQAGFGAGAAAVMSAHIVLPALEADLPATLSRRALHDLLRTELGYGGLAITDALDMKAVSERFDPGTAAVMALRAGADLPLTLGPLAVQRRALGAIEGAVAAGELDAGEYATTLGRIASFARRFPARPAGRSYGTGGETAGELADYATMAEATRRGLVAVGELPRLAPGDRIALIATTAVRANAASQLSARPADGLVSELERRGVYVERIHLTWGETADVTPGLGGMNPLPDAVVYVSTSRTRVADGEVASALRAAEWARYAGVPFVHVALWNPYSAAVVPGPALLAFGYRGSAPQAVVDALLGRPVTGKLPVPLTARA